MEGVLLDFPHLTRPVLGPTQPPTQWVLGLFPGSKAAGTWRWPPTPSSAEVKEREELYLYSWPVLGWTLTLPLYLSVHFLVLNSQTHIFYIFHCCIY